MVTTVAGAAWAAAGKADTKPAARITDAATRCQRPPIPFSLVIEPLLHRRVPQWWPVAAHQIGPGAAPSTVLCPYGNGRSRSRKPLAWDAVMSGSIADLSGQHRRSRCWTRIDLFG